MTFLFKILYELDVKLSNDLFVFIILFLNEDKTAGQQKKRFKHACALFNSIMDGISMGSLV